MTANQRHYLRHAISAHRLAAIRALQDEEDTYCAGCGTELSNYSLGCKTCHVRRHKRKKRGIVQHRQRGRCAGCGERYYERTPGCPQCSDRHRYHERRRAA